ncbi:5-dehydro-2-deoxygluconokinase, partial [Salmonella enterica subsp. enterica serovar Typhimurium]
MVDIANEVVASESALPPLKMLLLEGARQAALEAGLQKNSGILADTTVGQQALNDGTGHGWWIGQPVE